MVRAASPGEETPSIDSASAGSLPAAIVIRIRIPGGRTSQFTVNENLVIVECGRSNYDAGNCSFQGELTAIPPLGRSSLARTWTENQARAIAARGSDVLVAAGAGSGK